MLQADAVCYPPCVCVYYKVNTCIPKHFINQRNSAWTKQTQNRWRGKKMKWMNGRTEKEFTNENTRWELSDANARWKWHGYDRTSFHQFRQSVDDGFLISWNLADGRESRVGRRMRAQIFVDFVPTAHCTRKKINWPKRNEIESDLRYHRSYYLSV